MRPTINFGNTQIDAFEYAVNGNVLLATRGGGKTTAFKFIAESLMDINIPVIILDPVGKSRYLKNANPNNQNGKGYNIIVVGKDGDVELSLDTIEEVIRVALKTRSSLVIDLFDVSIIDSWDEIVTKIMKVLLYENKSLRHLIIEESSEWVHQESKKSGASVWIERLIRLSGNCKVGVTLVNQNSESLSKKVLKLCRGKILGAQYEANTIENIRKWLKKSGIANADQISESLSSLQAGDFWVWGASEKELVKVKVPDIKSLHPSRNDMNHMDVKESEDIETVLSKMNFKEESVYTQPKPVLNIPIFIQEEKPVEIVLPDIENMELSAYDRNTGYLAHKTPFGSGTVGSVIDGLVRKGYTIYNEYPFQLRNSNNKTFGLNSKIEREYAKLITKLVAQNA